ncbi:hypothetical protein GCM10025789_10050 [Tessaracoccus lubricantis]|uniref:ESX-1 secretion-associated protein n=1 Tax=Tessaracoccus lubricantis TaxID=545543 RepID=A0ABP9F671_9ACTN
MSVEFEPSTWDRGGSAVAEEAASFASRARSALGGMSTDALGCNGNGTLMDAAFAILFPAAIGAFAETADGLATGFDNIGLAMQDMGDAYRGIEVLNAEEAREAGL